MNIKAIAFDLDDTLLATTELLVPSASLKAFEILRQAGLTLSLTECEAFRLQMIKETSHKETFRILAEKYGSEKTVQALELANKAFYHPEIPEKLPLLDGALANLTKLQKKYSLYIVTAGFFEAQTAKIKALQIESYFKKSYIVNSLNNEKKYDAFKDICQKENILPSELLCIGNSLSSEIKDARLLGAWACYFEYGEDRGAIGNDPSLKPHFHIRKHAEFITACSI